VKDELITALNGIEKNIDERIAVLEVAFEKSERDKMDIQSEITQLKSVRAALHGELAQLETADKKK
jgi:hypothetical protein